MRIVFYAILYLGSLSLLASPRVEIFFESTSSGYEIFASNDEPCPVTVKFDFELINLTAEDAGKAYYVIPAKSKNYKITELKIKYKTKSYKFGYNTTFNYGDHTQKKYDVTFKYYLPFEKGATFRVSQGYHGDVSHQDKFALDFTMPVGTQITAARGGIVVDVVQENTKSCPSQDCEKYNNFVLIYHDDGTFGKYLHIKENGSHVAVGDSVEIGQPIAQSGNVGWSSGPHLHFEVFLQRINKEQTIRTNFLVDDGSDERILSGNQSYSRKY